MPDVVELIKAQHRRMDALLEQAEQAEPEQAIALLRQVDELLTPHSQAEESFVYPTIAKIAEEAGEEVEDGAAEHHHIEGLMEELLAAEPGGPGFDGVLAALIGELRHHVEEEETELLPTLSEKLDDAERERLGERFAAETGDSEGAGDAAPTPPGRAGQSASEQASSHPEIDLTRDELYEEAKDLGVPGRSGMNKTELADAVEKAKG